MYKSVNGTVEAKRRGTVRDWRCNYGVLEQYRCQRIKLHDAQKHTHTNTQNTQTRPWEGRNGGKGSGATFLLSSPRLPIQSSRPLIAPSYALRRHLSSWVNRLVFVCLWRPQSATVCHLFPPFFPAVGNLARAGRRFAQQNLAEWAVAAGDTSHDGPA